MQVKPRTRTVVEEIDAGVPSVSDVGQRSPITTVSSLSSAHGKFGSRMVSSLANFLQQDSRPTVKCESGVGKRSRDNRIGFSSVKPQLRFETLYSR